MKLKKVSSYKVRKTIVSIYGTIKIVIHNRYYLKPIKMFNRIFYTHLYKCNKKTKEIVCFKPIKAITNIDEKWFLLKSNFRHYMKDFNAISIRTEIKNKQLLQKLTKTN